MKQQLHFDKELTQWQSNDQFTQKNHRFKQKIHQKSQKNTLTQKSIDKRKSRPASSPVKSIQIKNSINQLRILNRHEELQSQKIKNRLQYLYTSTQRQQKLVNSAKLKFHKINQIRRQSFTDKSFFQKQRQNLLSQHSRTAYLQASKIKSERVRTSESQKKIILEKHNLAKAVKQERSLNESLINQKKQKQKSLLSQKVFKIHKQEELQRQKSANRNRQKVEQGIVNHKKDILAQYQKVQCRLKNNEKLMKSFQEKTSRICDKKMKQQEELQQFRAYLGLNKSELNHTTSKSSYHGIKSQLSHKPTNQNTKSMDHQNLNEFNQLKQKSSAYLRCKNGQKNIYLTNPEQ